MNNDFNAPNWHYLNFNLPLANEQWLMPLNGIIWTSTSLWPMNNDFNAPNWHYLNFNLPLTNE